MARVTEQVPVVSPNDLGYPGFLTAHEQEVLDELKGEVKKRGETFRDTIFTWPEEEEDYALCRWLRARKFRLDQVIKMIDEATASMDTPKKHNFFPSANEALGTDVHLFHTQYPQFLHGTSKSGYPVYYLQVGKLNIGGLECITSLQQMHNYQWHHMIHECGEEFRKNPGLKRFEVVSVVDLEGISRAHFSRKILKFISDESAIDALNFPETLHKLFIVNAPLIFSQPWKLIKSWLDPRTVSKIEIITNKKRSERILKETIPVEKLPLQYGGKANVHLHKPKILTKLLHGSVVNRRVSAHLCDLTKGESMSVQVYAHQDKHARVQFQLKSSENMFVKKEVNDFVANKGVVIAENINGPGSFTISTSGLQRQDSLLAVAFVSLRQDHADKRAME